VVFGERATFPFLPSVSQSSAEINLSALPSHEKEHVVQQSAEGNEEFVECDSLDSNKALCVYVCLSVCLFVCPLKTQELVG